MSDDPFARAVERAQAAEHAEALHKRQRRQEMVSSGARTGFRVHVSVYLAVNLLLVAIWATTTPGYPWFLWPLLGWGVGVVAHYAAVGNHLGRRSHAAPPAQPAYVPAPVPAPTPVAAAAAPVAAAPPASGSSTAEEIKRLADLHRAGALSDEEFTAAKAKLLS